MLYTIKDNINKIKHLEIAQKATVTDLYRKQCYEKNA